MSYLNSIFLGAHPVQQIGVRNAAELRSLAESLDALDRGDLPALGDLMMSRFQAVETASTEGDWSQAQHMDLAAQGRVTLANTAVRLQAAKTALIEKKLQELRGAGARGSGAKKDR